MILPSPQHTHVKVAFNFMVEDMTRDFCSLYDQGWSIQLQSKLLHLTRDKQTEKDAESSNKDDAEHKNSLRIRVVYAEE